MRFDVVIIGAGVIGSMLARHLSRYNLRVCVLEKENDVAMGASKANSGIIHGGFDPVPGTLKAKLNSAGVEALFEAAQQLNVPCIRNGSMVCAFSQDDEQILDELLKQGLENGIPNLYIITGDEARMLEPYLSEEITKVLYVPNAGVISPYELVIAAIGNAMDNGVALKRNFDVVNISKSGEMFTINALNGEVVEANYIVNCAGGYSDRIAKMVGDDFFTVIPRAGEYLLLDKTEGFRAKHTLFQCPSSNGKGVLVSPTAHGNLLIGPNATVVSSPDSVDTTVDGLEEVMELAKKTVPSVNYRQVITSFTGVRASNNNGDFILQPSDNYPGIIHAGAIDSPGLTCCVSIADFIIDLLQEEGLVLEQKVDWNGFRKSPCSFRDLSDEEKNERIQVDPSFGKIVCRCENVSEGEIIQAIRQNPGAVDLDGVKRRTRSGMGRCQGGFCGPYVMQLLSREMMIPMECVTKFGKGSEMLVRGSDDQ